MGCRHTKAVEIRENKGEDTADESSSRNDQSSADIKMEQRPASESISVTGDTQMEKKDIDITDTDISDYFQDIALHSRSNSERDIYQPSDNNTIELQVNKKDMVSLPDDAYYEENPIAETTDTDLRGQRL